RRRLLRDQERLFAVLLVVQETTGLPSERRSHGWGVTGDPHCTLHTALRLGVLVAPGCVGTPVEEKNVVLLEWLEEIARAEEVAGSVCTCAFLYAIAGLLEGRPAATHVRQRELFWSSS